jgi:hypothetical protein
MHPGVKRRAPLLKPNLWVLAGLDCGQLIITDGLEGCPSLDHRLTLDLEGRIVGALYSTLRITLLNC